MNKTKIEWCDSTWNPVTGCLHSCEYCYARKIANRFGGCDKDSTYGAYTDRTWKRVNPKSELSEAIFEVGAERPPIKKRFDKEKKKQLSAVAPYPWGFQPTLRRDRLDIPKKWSEPRTIFACSMADLFGDWVPDEWIEEVFAACEKAPQHTYLFLTKNPERYVLLSEEKKLPIAKKMWYGTTVTNAEQMKIAAEAFGKLPIDVKTFFSIEPIMEDIANADGWKKSMVDSDFVYADSVVIGAETGNRKCKTVPQKDWIDKIVSDCDSSGVTVFMKDSLVPIVGEKNMRRVLLWKTK